MPYHAISSIPSTALVISLIAFPGLAGSYVYRKLRGGRRFRANWEILFEVIGFALIGYTTSTIVLSTPYLPLWFTNSINILQTLIPDTTPPDGTIQPCQIAFLLIFTTIISTLFAIPASYVHQRNWLNKLGIKLGISNRIGDEDVWESFLETLDHVIVRDAQTKRTYYGLLTNMSESDRPRELALEDVRVYDEDGTRLYNLRKIYLSRPPSQITLELDPTPLNGILAQ